MIKELVEMLKAITQFDDVSLQPNSGANVNKTINHSGRICWFIGYQKISSKYRTRA
jgi:hypothetical protein